jgi:tetratricopeptide (TPR) repeat protein
MFSSTVNFKAQVVFLPLLLLLAATSLLRPLESQLHGADVRVSLTGGLSGNGLLGVLGGMRAAVAGGFWLRTNQAWEKRDAAGTTALLHLTVAADERPLYFWLNGARMLAYDIPLWADVPARPEAARRKAVREGVDAALTFLETGLRAHPQSAEILIEMANIQLRVGKNPEAAAVLFRRAAEQPGAPYYAARIHGELLRELGRPGEALAWLKAILPDLPADDPAAARAVVEQRIKALEAGRDEK